ncbi:hypothetical protein CPB83DRAFT_227553 [Crepidotus variabilis]|uniref:Uncharacterized protein n=1 Tax=Crepidotus variabilis TaxID=179855 RepID=A0A9P6JWV5_9AGAR|nr:hypothetical protein CPB83DRAFT_227553 [Crepidotus variabilis]
MLWMDIGDSNDDNIFKNTYLRLVYAMLGLYTWEWASSLQFEFDLLTGRKKFKWPLVFYFLCRYFPFLHLGILPRMSSDGSWPNRLNSHRIDCRPLYVLLYIVGHGSVALAGNNLALRAMALWPGKKYLKFALWLIILGQWAVILWGAPALPGGLQLFHFAPTECHGWFTFIDGSLGAFLYALIFDLLILGLTLYKLVGTINVSFFRRQDGPVRYILVAQGTSYMVISITVNLLALLLIELAPQSRLVADFIVPFQVVAPLIACRMVRQLVTFSDSEAVESIAQNTKNRVSIQFKHTVATDATTSSERAT